jgi:hypothetical protein
MFKNPLYNVDIRSKREKEKKGKEHDILHSDFRRLGL